MKSFKEIKTDVKSTFIKRIKEKSTWVGVITKIASVIGFSLTGMPIEYIAGLAVTYVGGIFTAANTTK